MLIEVFLLEDNRVVLNPELLLIPEFRNLYKQKELDAYPTVMDWFSHMYFMLHPESSYGNLTEKEREEVLDEDFPIDTSDPYYNLAKRKLAYLFITPSKKIYDSTKILIDKLTDYATSLDDITDGRDGNLPQLITLIKSSKSLLESYREIEYEYKKEVVEARGKKGISWDSKERYE